MRLLPVTPSAARGDGPDLYLVVRSAERAVRRPQRRRRPSLRRSQQDLDRPSAVAARTAPSGRELCERVARGPSIRRICRGQPRERRTGVPSPGVEQSPRLSFGAFGRAAPPAPALTAATPAPAVPLNRSVRPRPSSGIPPRRRLPHDERRRDHSGSGWASARAATSSARTRPTTACADRPVRDDGEPRASSRKSADLAAGSSRDSVITLPVPSRA